MESEKWAFSESEQRCRKTCINGTPVPLVVGNLAGVSTPTSRCQFLIAPNLASIKLTPVIIPPQKPRSPLPSPPLRLLHSRPSYFPRASSPSTR